KQEVLALSLNTSDIEASAGSSYTLSASVTSKYGVKGLTVSGADFTAAGGTLTATDSTHVKVTLPAYRTTQFSQAAKAAATSATTDLNTYTLTAVASDLKGNTSAPKTVTVTVLPPSLVLTGVEVRNDNQLADGKAEIEVATLVTDSSGVPVADEQVTFTTTYADGSTDSETAVTSQYGFASVMVTSTVAGQATVKVTAGSSSKSTTITFTDVPQKTFELRVVKDNQEADGTSAAVVDTKLSSGVAITFTTTFADGTTKSQTVVANDAEVAAAKITSTVAGEATVTGTVGGVSKSTTINFTSRTINIGSMNAANDNQPADGVQEVKVSAQLYYNNGDPVVGQEVTFATTYSDGTTSSQKAVTDSTGQVSVGITSTVTGDAMVTVTAGGISKTTTITFTDQSLMVGDINIANNNQPADGTSSVKASITVLDSNYNAVKGKTVTFTTTYADGSTNTLTAVTNAGGFADVSITSTVPGDAKVNASVGTESKNTTIRFTSIQRIADSGVNNNGAIADGVSFATVYVLIDDNSGVLAGHQVTFTTTYADGSTNTQTAVTNDSGYASVNVSSTVAGTASVDVTSGTAHTTVSITYPVS
ncbi:Ig-like domain-containing protein, partial [Enterobacter cloacae]